MPAVYMILYILGFVCFVLAILWSPPHPRVNLIALGLAFWILVSVIESIRVVAA